MTTITLSKEVRILGASPSKDLTFKPITIKDIRIYGQPFSMTGEALPDVVITLACKSTDAVEFDIDLLPPSDYVKILNAVFGFFNEDQSPEIPEPENQIPLESTPMQTPAAEPSFSESGT